MLRGRGGSAFRRPDGSNLPSGEVDRGGNRVIQLDPATNQLRSYDLDLSLLDSDPHGIFFDFETHLTPRVWFVQRNADRVSYLDLESNELVSYDLRQLLGVDEDAIEVHAVTVDRRGNVWVTDVVGNRVLELDFDFMIASEGQQPVPTPSLNSRIGMLTVHTSRPSATRGTPRSLPASGPHGIDVVVDDTTNEAYVYVTELGDGTINLLRPGVGGGADVWIDWNLDAPTAAEGMRGRRPQFLSVDTNETPGYPVDDRILFADSGLRPLKIRTTSSVNSAPATHLAPQNTGPPRRFGRGRYPGWIPRGRANRPRCSWTGKGKSSMPTASTASGDSTPIPISSRSR